MIKDVLTARVVEGGNRRFAEEEMLLFLVLLSTRMMLRRHLWMKADTWKCYLGEAFVVLRTTFSGERC
jgi:hypothetical protein